MIVQVSSVKEFVGQDVTELMERRKALGWNELLGEHQPCVELENRGRKERSTRNGMRSVMKSDSNLGRWEIIAHLHRFPDFYRKRTLMTWRSPCRLFIIEILQGRSTKKVNEQWQFCGVLGMGAGWPNSRDESMPHFSWLFSNNYVEKRPPWSKFVEFGVPFGRRMPSVTCDVSFQEETWATNGELSVPADDFWLRTEPILPRPRRRAGHKHSRCTPTIVNNSRFSGFNFQRRGSSAPLRF